MSKYNLSQHFNSYRNAIKYVKTALKNENLNMLIKDFNNEIRDCIKIENYYDFLIICRNYIDLANESAERNGWFEI